MQFRLKNATVFEGLIVLLCILAVAKLVYSHAAPPAVPPGQTEAQFVAAADNNALEQPIITDSGVPENGIPSLDAPTFVPVSQAMRELESSGHGLVVLRGGVVRFYPYQILTWHEVVNDSLGGAPIAVTYCALCNVGAVYDRRVGDEVLSFGVSGKLQDSDSLLFDRTTHSLWSQVTGEALEGQLRGKKLSVLESSVMTLREFSVAYPNGGVLSKFTGFVRNYDDLSYGDYATAIGGDAVIAAKKLLHPKTVVIGISVGEKTKAYPINILEKKKVVDSFGGAKIELVKNGEGVSVTEVSTGTQMPFVEMNWFLWQAWHPETVVYR